MRRLVLMVLLLSLLPLAIFAFGNYHSVATPGFKVYYRDGWEDEALRVLQVMEYYRPYVYDLTGHPVGQAVMVIEDMGNEVNGYMNLLGDKIALFAYPPTADELSNGEDWWQLVGIHEYIHRTQMTSASGIPGFLQKAFGNALYPSIHQPNWITEGITVYGESNLSPYTGRMRGGYYNNVITALVKEGKLPSRAKATIYSRDTPLAQFYVYGGSFFSYLAEHYGKDKFARLFAKQGKNPMSYLSMILPAVSIDGYFKDTYGVPLDSLWNDWRAYEASRDIRLPEDRITHNGWNYSYLQNSDGEIYYSRNKRIATGPFSNFGTNYIVRLYDPEGEAREEILLSQATDLPAGFKVFDNRLYYTRSEYRGGFGNNENNGLGSVTELWVKDLSGGKAVKFLSGAIRSFCILPEGEILVATDEANYRGNAISLYSPQGELISEPRAVKMLIGNMVAHESKIYVTGKEEWKSTSVYELSLPELEFTPLIDTPYAEKLVGITDGYLIFDAPYGDQLNSYAYDLTTAQTFKVSGLSGLRSTQLTDEDKFYTIGMHAGGEDIYRGEVELQPFALPQSEPAQLPPALTYSAENPLILDKYPVKKGRYWSNLTHLLYPRFARIPYVMGTPDSLSLGVYLMGQDVLGDFPGWNARLEYDLKSKALGVDISLANNLLRPVLQELSYSSFDKGSFRADQYLNLLNRKNYGVSRAWLGFAFTGEDGFERNIWDGYAGMNFSWESGRLGMSQAVFVEREDFLPSDRERLGWQSWLSLKQKITPRTQLLAQLHYAYEPDADLDEIFSTIRGYDSRWQQNRGLNFTSTFNFPLAEVREGIWTPQLYVEDIFGGLFFDASVPYDLDEGDTRLSGGVEVVSELTLASIIPIGLGVRLSLNKDGKWMPGLILGANF